VKVRAAASPLPWPCSRGTGTSFKVVHQHLIYPMIDDRTCLQADPHPFTEEIIWTRGDAGR